MVLPSLCKRAIAITMSVSMLVGCASTAKNKEEESDRDRIIKTAKINSQLGIAYLEKGNPQRAKQKLLIALSQAPHIPEPWYSMGYFLEATGDKAEAKTYYLKALAIAPNRGDAQNNFGTFLCRSGQYEESIQHFVLATRDVDYLDVGSAYENAGLCAMKIPDNKMAAHYFELALKQDPMRQLSLYKLAEVNYAQGNYKKAKSTLGELMQLTAPTTETIALSSKIDKRLMPTPAHLNNTLVAETIAKPMNIVQPVIQTKPIAFTTKVEKTKVSQATKPIVKPVALLTKSKPIKATHPIKHVASLKKQPTKVIVLKIKPNKMVTPTNYVAQAKKPATKIIALHTQRKPIA